MTVFERLNQFVEREVVAVSGQRCVVMGRFGEAVAAGFTHWRGQRAARAAGFGQFGQAADTGGTQQVLIAGSAAEQAILGQPAACAESCKSLQALVLR